MGSGKRNTEIKKTKNKSARYVYFSKRREGLYKKTPQYHKISGSLIAVLVFPPTKRAYVHGSPSFDPIVDHFLHSSPTSSMMTITTAESCVTESSVSDSAPTDEGLIEKEEAINVEGSDNLEKLLEMRRKPEEVKDGVM